MPDATLSKRDLMEASEIPGQLISFLQALAETQWLRTWFLRLETLSPQVRQARLASLASQMRQQNEDRSVISIVEALCQDSVYRAMRQTIQEICDVDDADLPPPSGA